VNHTQDSGQTNHDRSAIARTFGRNLFSFATMRQWLPRGSYEQLLKTIEQGGALTPSLADVVANAMKDWAVERGATHYCHWFQPLTGLTAEKHEAFVSPTAEGGILLEFSGKDLTRGEPDASSFPSGSLRESFEARGYTVWDYTSPVFVKEDGRNVTLFIPSAFCSYAGDALDYKTPLLRANEAINRQALRVLRALGNTRTKRVFVTLGAEQEYFLIGRSHYRQRLDLVQSDRTLFGLPTPKGMAMSVHYFGSVHERVASFMHDLNEELWKLGISAKTQHHEISPHQFEIAQVFAPANVASDQNQLTMEALGKIAERHDMACLLHDKPFATFGGSGKHINWSLATDDGINLLDPGETPHENEVFLLFLCAVIRAVDSHAALMRASVADAGNDHRLGAMEAPPAIISLFLGDQLDDIIDQLARGTIRGSKRGETIRLGVSSLPPLPRDVTDRNRTSPFAFTGSKFEFRTPGSATTVARPAFVLSTIVADVLREMADELEQARDVNTTAQKMLKRIVREHRRVVFNGDNYAQDWVEEAARRKLANLPDAIDAYRAIENNRTIELFDRQGVLSGDEFTARMDASYAHYAQALLIEARCMTRMGFRQLLPAAMRWASQLAAGRQAVEAAGEDAADYAAELNRLCRLIREVRRGLTALADTIAQVSAIQDDRDCAAAARDRLLPEMAELRGPADQLEEHVDATVWPWPTYDRMMSAW
jgi:glutamine synthetase